MLIGNFYIILAILFHPLFTLPPFFLSYLTLNTWLWIDAQVMRTTTTTCLSCLVCLLDSSSFPNRCMQIFVVRPTTILYTDRLRVFSAFRYRSVGPPLIRIDRRRAVRFFCTWNVHCEIALQRFQVVSNALVALRVQLICTNASTNERNERYSNLEREEKESRHIGNGFSLSLIHI